ncbi:MAG TPA: DUF2892 domain-containing protein [Thermoanaerobaculia bacterium]
MAKFLASNEGAVDRILRIVIGVAVLSLTVVGPKTLWGVLGVVPLITGLAGTCPLYSIVGITTCPTKTRTATQS